MRVFVLHGAHVHEAPSPLAEVPHGGFVWIACSREQFAAQLPHVQETLQRLTGVQLVDLHVSDLLNAQLPSHYDYTSQYDMLVFRRLAAPHHAERYAAAVSYASPGNGAQQAAVDAAATRAASALGRIRVAAGRKGRSTGSDDTATPPVLRSIDTNPVGFVVLDQVLLTVHPTDCLIRDAFASRLLSGHATEVRASGARTPSSPADLMLRLINLMVDGYLELRRELNQQLDGWQAELLRPKSRFNDWSALLDARLSLHQLDQICEDQRSAVQDWIDALETWPPAPTPSDENDRELLKVRSRDVLEHIERVVHHVRRLEQSSETTVQMHFSLQSNRTNDIMRVLTTLTAVFLPLNLIAGIFGMNFVSIPLLHKQDGFWWAMGSMAAIAAGLVAWFWRKQYLDQPSR
jgi:magnesium transporter